MSFSNKRSVLVCAGLGVSHLLFAAAGWAQSPVSFVARSDYGVGSFPYSVAVGDFNGDGVPDLGVANGSFDNISVLINDTPR